MLTAEEARQIAEQKIKQATLDVVDFQIREVVKEMKFETELNLYKEQWDLVRVEIAERGYKTSSEGPLQNGKHRYKVWW